MELPGFVRSSAFALIRIWERVGLWFRDRPKTLILGIYGIGNGLIVLNGNPIWDDWHTEFLSRSDEVSLYLSMGNPVYAVLDWLERSVGQKYYLSRILTFLSFGAIHLLFYRILALSGWVEERAAFWIAFLSAVIPQYFSRVCYPIQMYTVSLFLFAGAFLLVARRSHEAGPVRRALTLLLFALSFSLQSLYFFYLVPALYAYCRDSSRPWTSRWATLRFAGRNADFLFLPFGVLFLTRFAFPATGSYQGYNALTWEGLVNAPHFLWQSAVVGIWDWSRTYLPYRYFLFVGALLMLAAAARWGPDRLRLRRGFALMAVAALLFLAAILPYAWVGKVISWYYIGDRNSVLTLFALPIGLFGIGDAVFSVSRAVGFRNVALLALALVFADASARGQEEFLKLSVKEDALVSVIAREPVFRKATTFRFGDEATDYNAKGTPFESSQLVGVMRRALGGTHRCGSLNPQECFSLPPRITAEPVYSLTDYKPRRDELLVRILPARTDLSLAEVVRLSVLRVIDRTGYDRETERVLSLEISPLE